MIVVQAIMLMLIVLIAVAVVIVSSDKVQVKIIKQQHPELLHFIENANPNAADREILSTARRLL